MRPSLAVLPLLIAFLPFTGACRRQAGAASAPAGQAAPAPATAAAPAVPPPPAYNGPTVDVPAGSRLVMRLDENVDSGKGAGLRLRSSLEAALPDASGNVIVPAGTKVMGVIMESKQA